MLTTLKSPSPAQMSPDLQLPLEITQTYILQRPTRHRKTGPGGHRLEGTELEAINQGRIDQTGPVKAMVA